MIGSKVLLPITAFLFIAVAGGPAFGGTEWFVDGSVPASGDGKSWATAFRTIQKGIDASSDGDTVTVAEETYFENIKLNGKDIVLRSTNPLNTVVVSRTIIDGFGIDSVVAFSGTETDACVLSGFTIRNGTAAFYGGGIYGLRTGATIENNIITGNSTPGVNSCGGGIAHCNGTIRNNVIHGNSAGAFAGGVYWCEGLIEGNTVANNTSYRHGGGLSRCHGTIRVNTITGNTTEGAGGGLEYCDGIISNNMITSNSAESGGGLEGCDGIVENNIITDNTAEHGGGFYMCDATVHNNFIARNTASGSGGGLFGGDGILESNSIVDNSAVYGGGLRSCSGTILNNTIIGNSATNDGGGMYQCNGSIFSNLLCGNSAGRYGGGLNDCNAAIHNNTITGNSAQQDGGGLYGCEGAIQNSIIWHNSALGNGPQLYVSSQPTFSCIQDWTGGGQGNINVDPGFVDEDGPDNNLQTYGDNNYRLTNGSLCIDRGKNEQWMWESLDLAGNPRIFYGVVSLTVDMGAYEHGSIHFKITRIAFTTIPFPGGTRLTWNSRPGDTYSVWSCNDLHAEWVKAATVASQGDTTSYTLTGLFPIWLRARFYRVGLDL